MILQNEEMNMKKLLLALFILLTNIQTVCSNTKIPTSQEISKFEALKPFIIRMMENIEDKISFENIQTVRDHHPDLFSQFINHEDSNGNSFLTQAIIENNAQKVQLLIDLGVDIHQKNYFGFTPIHQTIIRNADKVFPVLIAAGANVNQKDSRGHAPLHWAATLITDQPIQLLVAAKADVNQQNDEGNTPLYRAAFWDNQKNLSLLIAAGADTEITNKYGRTVSEVIESWNQATIQRNKRLAATKIQTVSRGFLDRQKVKNMKLEVEKQSGDQLPQRKKLKI